MVNFLKNVFTLFHKNYLLEQNKGFRYNFCYFVFPCCLIFSVSTWNLLLTLFFVIFNLPDYTSYSIDDTGSISLLQDSCGYVKEDRVYCENLGRSSDEYYESYYCNERFLDSFMVVYNGKEKRSDVEKVLDMIPKCYCYDLYHSRGMNGTCVDSIKYEFLKTDEFDITDLRENNLKSAVDMKGDLTIDLYETFVKFRNDSGVYSSDTNTIMHYLGLSKYYEAIQSNFDDEELEGIVPTYPTPQFGHRIGLKIQSTLELSNNQYNSINLFLLFIYPICLSFLLPSFTVKVIKEKQKGVTNYLYSFGVTVLQNEIARFLFDYIYYSCYLVMVLLISLIAQVKLIYHSNVVGYLLLFLIWGILIISLSYLLASVQTNTHIASYVGFFIVIVSILASGFMCSKFSTIASFPWYLMLYPFIPFMRGLTFLFVYIQKDLTVVPTNLDYEFWICVLYLFVETVVVFVLYILIRFNILRFIYNKIRKLVQNRSSNNSDGDLKVLLNEDDSGNKLLVIKGITKQYGKKKVLNNVSFCIEKSECFGLLGPNGAGKTTLISILTGLIDRTSGYAKIGNLDCTLDYEKVQQKISFCPQFDTVFDDLTCYQNIQFFSRLRGVPFAKEKEYVENILKEVELLDHRRQLCKNLSGGYKRRLSVAVSICGDVDIIFLDEPSSSLDPACRRSIWEIIERLKTKKSIVLTTHDIFEAENLCDRIGVLNKGCLLTVDRTFALKETYGKGYKLTIQAAPQFHNMIEEYIKSIIPNLLERQILSNTITYRIPSGSFKFSEVFQKLRKEVSDKLGIQTWSINQDSLDEVFFKLVEMHESKYENQSGSDIQYSNSLRYQGSGYSKGPVEFDFSPSASIDYQKGESINV